MTTTRELPMVTVVGVVVLMVVAACGAAHPLTGNALSDNEFDTAVAQVKGAGKPAYYLGDTYGGLPLTGLDLVEENAPAFQVEADYGTCDAGGDGGCAAPVVVSTNDWRPDLQVMHCQRLAPQLGVPAGVLMGELTLATNQQLVTVTDFRERPAGDGVQPALRALSSLRQVGQAAPVDSLPPPTPEVSAWMDEVCGAKPGQEVSHDPGEGAGALDNQTVPDFTVERLGGGELAWSDHKGKPVVVVVGTGTQVAAAVRRLRPIVQKAPSAPTLIGLVTDPTGDKFNPRPVSAIEAEVGDLGVPVGYAAVPLSAVWFLDSAGNRGNATTPSSQIGRAHV